MRWWLLVVLAVCALGMELGFPSIALASARVDLTEVTMPADVSSAKLEKTLRTLLHRSAKPLNFGGGKRIEVSVRLTELTIEESDDIVRVTCTLIGRLKGGGSARSHISFGGKPARKKELQRQVLAMVSDGVMSRLAEMARTREALEKKKTGTEKPKDKTHQVGSTSKAKSPEPKERDAA